MLGGGIIAGELWWPGQKLISIPKEPELRFKATERYSFGFTDAQGVFGLAPIKREGESVIYDPGPVQWSRVDDPEDYAVEPLVANLSEESLEQLCIEIAEDGRPFRA